MTLLSNINQINLPNQEVQRLPSDFSDIVGAAANQTWLNFNSISSDVVLGEANDWQADAYNEATGGNYYDDLRPTPEEFADRRNELVSVGALNKYRNDKLDLMRTENPDKFKTVPNFEETKEYGKQLANKSTEDLVAAQYYTRSSSPGFAGFVGMTGAVVADPVNLGTMLFGGGKTVLQLMLNEAKIGILSELATQVRVAEWQKQLGNEYGIDDITMNVLMAGAGAAGLSGTIKSGSVMFSRMANNYTSNAPVNAALRQLSEDAHLKENDLSTTIYGSRQHLEAVDFGDRALKNGYMPDSKAVSKANVEAFIAKQDLEHVSWTTSARDKGIDFDSKEDLDGFIKEKIEQEYIDDLVAEKELQIPRGDVKELRAQLKEINHRIEKLDVNNDYKMMARERLGKKTKAKEVIKEVKRIKQVDEKALSTRKEKIKSSLAAQDKAKLAEGDLSRFGQGIIPDRFMPLVAEIKASMREINTELNAKPKPTDIQSINFVRQIEEMELVPNIRSKVEIDDALDNLESPDADLGTMKDFDRAIKDNPDMDVYMDDGSAIKMRDLQEKFKEDEEMLEAITGCAL